MRIPTFQNEEVNQPWRRKCLSSSKSHRCFTSSTFQLWLWCLPCECFLVYLTLLVTDIICECFYFSLRAQFVYFIWFTSIRDSLASVSVHCRRLAILVWILQCVWCCQLHPSCSREASHRWRRPVSSVCCSVLFWSNRTSLLLSRRHSVPVEAASLLNFVPEEVVQVLQSLFLMNFGPEEVAAVSWT